MDVPAWLVGRVRVTESGCWAYTRSKPNRWGYPVIHVKRGVKKLAHRWVYERMVGPIPEGRDLPGRDPVPAPGLL